MNDVFKNLCFYSGICFLVMACSSSQPGLFGTSKTAHQKYSDGLKDAGLRESELGKLWFDAANKGLQQPKSITLPYKETGYFAAEVPSAMGYVFNVKRGQQVVVELQHKPASQKKIFAELWQTSAAGSEPKFAAALDTTSQNIRYNIAQDGKFTVRLQPELLQAVEYTVTISTAASLAFPVQASGKPRIASVWGADRDGGARSHEGIDIVAKFRTPALAAANGTVTRVEENNLGGKVIFLRPDGSDLNLYYAHLDTQIAQPGQQVKTGEVIGLVGQTGNARNTVPHLHFGIYTNGGAIDPLAFIEPTAASPKAVAAPIDVLGRWGRLVKATDLLETSTAKSKTIEKISSGNILRIWAATDNVYWVSLPNGTSGYVASNAVSFKPLQLQNIKKNTPLLDAPSIDAAAKNTLSVGTSINVLGKYNDFYYVGSNGMEGWIKVEG